MYVVQTGHTDAFEVLRVLVDFESCTLWLEVGDAVVVEVQCEGLDALNARYAEDVGAYFEDNDCFGSEGPGDELELLDLPRWFRCFEAHPLFVVGAEVRPGLRTLAETIVCELLYGWNTPDAVLENLVLYWVGDRCVGYINCPEIETQDLARPSGLLVERTLFGYEDVPGDRISFMESLCRLLESERCFGRVPVAPNFSAHHGQH